LAVKYPEKVKELKKSGVIGVTREEYEGFEAKWSQSKPQANPKQTLGEPLTPAPAPSPAPSPTPIVIKDLPPTACAKDDDQFSMHADWTPSEYFPTLANTAGVVPPTGDELETALREFVPFWMTQKRRCTAHEWDLAFIKAIKSGFATPRNGPRSNGEDGQLQARSVRDALILQGEQIARAINDDERRKQQHLGSDGGQAGGVLLEHQV
jgi:hypothetical protein